MKIEILSCRNARDLLSVHLKPFTVSHATARVALFFVIVVFFLCENWLWIVSLLVIVWLRHVWACFFSFFAHWESSFALCCFAFLVLGLWLKHNSGLFISSIIISHMVLIRHTVIFFSLAAFLHSPLACSLFLASVNSNCVTLLTWVW